MSNPKSNFADRDCIPVPHDLTPLNTLGLRSQASAYLRVDDVAVLPTVSSYAGAAERWFVLGGGSNLVLPDPVQALVIHVGLKGIRRMGHTLTSDGKPAHLVEAAAGESWHDFVSYCVDHQLDGLENLALIPGSVGAAPVQNIGAYGIEIADRLHAVVAWDMATREIATLSAAQCRLAYRDSRFKHEVGRWIILAVQFALPVTWRACLAYPDLQRHAGLAQASAVTARDVFDAVCEIRRAKLPDPARIGNAGSFFKNPIVDAASHAALLARFPDLVAYPTADGTMKLAAGWLIDQCGWKGRRMGAAAVHDRQALVIVNAGGATARDILALAHAIQHDVQARFGVMLEPEPVIIQ